MPRYWAVVVAVVLIVGARIAYPSSTCLTSCVARELYKLFDCSLLRSSVAKQLIHTTSAWRAS